MLTVEEALMTRLTGDSTLQTLLGGASRIWHAMEQKTPVNGSITYMKEFVVPSQVLRTQNVEAEVEFYIFHIFHEQYEAVQDRLYRLLHNYRFPTPSDAGIKSCVWEWTGPDEFDEALMCGAKRVRYKLEVIRSAQSPV